MRCNFIKLYFVTVCGILILFSGGSLALAQGFDLDAAIQSAEKNGAENTGTESTLEENSIDPETKDNNIPEVESVTSPEPLATTVSPPNNAGSYVSDKDISARIQKQVKLLDERRVKFRQTQAELLEERKTEINQTNQLKERIDFRIEQKKVHALKKNKLWFGDEQFSSPKSLDTLIMNQYSYPDYMESVRENVIRPQVYFEWAYEGTSDVEKVDITKNEQRNTLLHLQTRRSRKTAFSDVLFPHKTHTYWLNCISCHPAPFEEKVGGTTGLTMAENYRSKFCGKCHGTVAFSTKVPLRQCLLCHIDTRSFRTAIERGKNYEIAH